MNKIDLMQLERIEQEYATLRVLFPPLAAAVYVGGEGPEDLPVEAFVIGEAPGAQEAARKKPFVGPSGLVLRQLMGIGGLTPARCWITNAVNYRPPRNRKPTQEEIQVFRRPLMREWHVVGKPPLIIAVGNTALSAVLGKPTSIIRHAGKPIHRNNGVIVWPMIHPSFGLREPNAREWIEQDWEKLKTWQSKPRTG